MKTNHHLEKIARSAGIITAGMVLGGFLNYISRMVIARWLGSSVYGLLSLAIAFSGVIFVFSLFGLSQGLARYIPYYKAKNEQGKLKGAIVTSLKITLPLSLVLAGFIALLSTEIAISVFNKPALAPILQIFAFLIPAKVLLNLFSSCLRGFKASKYKVYVVDLFEPVIRLSLILGFVLLGLSLFGVSLAYLISFSLASLLAFYYLETKVFSFFRSKIKAETVTKDLIDFSWPMMLAGVLVMVLDWIDVLMLGAFKASAEVGIYNVALPTSALLIWVLGAFNFLFRPTISELFSKNKTEAIGQIFKKVSRWVFIIGLPLFLLMLIFPGRILGILFGPGYSAGGLALSILAVGYFIFSFTGTSSSVLVSIGKTKKVLSIAIVTLASNIVLNLFLIPVYGMIGAATALTLSFIIASSLSVFSVYKEIEVHPFSQSLAKPSLPIFVFLPALLVVKQNIALSFPRIIILGLLFLISYLAFTKFFKILTEDDLGIVKSLIAERT